jgi:hypothetical protein
VQYILFLLSQILLHTACAATAEERSTRLSPIKKDQRLAYAMDGWKQQAELKPLISILLPLFARLVAKTAKNSKSTIQIFFRKEARKSGNHIYM